MADLELKSILRKTEAGIDAIKLRDRALTPKQRMLLIVVDGTKTIAELLKPMPDPQEALQLLGDLRSAGYVYELEPAQAIKNPEPPVPVKAASSAPDASLKPAIQRTTRLLEELLGPTCEPLCLQLEKCKNRDEFTAKVHDFRRIVASMRSEKKADEFVSAALSA